MAWHDVWPLTFRAAQKGERRGARGAEGSSREDETAVRGGLKGWVRVRMAGFGGEMRRAQRSYRRMGCRP